MRVQTWKQGAVEWSPSFIREHVGFAPTFGRFRFLGEAQYLSADQLDALTDYAATIDRLAQAQRVAA